jgi:hypothetical protein
VKVTPVMNSTATVCGGTLTVTKPPYITLSSASIGATARCTFSVTVTAMEAALQSYGADALNDRCRAAGAPPSRHPIWAVVPDAGTSVGEESTT